MNLSDVKTAVDSIGSAFDAFKAANDERLVQLEKRGASDPLTDEKLARVEGTLAQFEDLNQRLTQEAEARKASDTRTREQLDKIETAIGRPHQGGGAGGADLKVKQAFLKYCRTGKEGLGSEELKALTVSNDTTGGYLAPSEYVREIIKAETEISQARTICRVRQTSQREVTHPKRTGQFAAQWVAEQGTRSETQGLTYGLERIPTHELYALVDISEQDLEDSEFDLEGELTAEFSEQFAVADGAAFVSGNGVGRPAGWMTSTVVAVDNSGSAATIADANGQANGLMTLYHNLKTAYARNGVWVMNRRTIGDVRKLKDGQQNYVWQPGLASNVPNTILGAPYVEMPDMPDVAANALPIAFGDFRRAYLIVDRIVMSVLRDPFTQATSGNIRFVARKRVGGQVVLAEAIRKLQVVA